MAFSHAGTWLDTQVNAEWAALPPEERESWESRAEYTLGEAVTGRRVHREWEHVVRAGPKRLAFLNTKYSSASAAAPVVNSHEQVGQTLSAEPELAPELLPITNGPHPDGHLSDSFGQCQSYHCPSMMRGKFRPLAMKPHSLSHVHCQCK